MATIGNLAAILTAKDVGFSAGLKKASSDLSRFGGVMQGVAAGVGIGLASMAARAATALGGVIPHQMEAIDASAKLADTLGISTEALAGLQHAANLSGVSGELLTDSIGKMERVIGEAVNGSKTAQDAIGALGLDFYQLATQKPEQTFAQIADALNAIANPSQRAAAAQEIFGRSAKELMPLLREGSVGLGAMSAEAEKLGLSMSRVDAAKVEQANDALTKVQGLLTGLLNTLVVEISPYITKAAEDFIAWGTSGGNASKMVVSAVSQVLKGVAFLADTIDVVRIGWIYFKSAGQSALGAMLKPITTVAESLGKLNDMLGISGTAAGKAFSDGLAVLKGTQASLIAEWTDGMAEIEKIKAKKSWAQQTNEWLIEASKSAQTYGEQVAAAADKNREFALTLSDATSPFEMAEEAASKLIDFGAAGSQEYQGAGLIMADSAQAQVLQYQAGRGGEQQQMLAVARSQLSTLEDIKDNTEPRTEDEIEL